MFSIRSSRITCEQVDDVYVVCIRGRLTRGSGGCETVRELIPRLVKDGAKHIVVDLQKAGKIDDSGLGELISATQHAVWRGCALAFASLPESFQKLLRKRMVCPFPAVGGGPYDSVEVAVRSLPVAAKLLPPHPAAVLIQWVKPQQVLIGVRGQPVLTLWALDRTGQRSEIGNLVFDDRWNEDGIRRLLGLGHRWLVLDVTSLEHPDSSYFVEFILAWGTAQSGGGRLVLVSSSQRDLRALEAMKPKASTEVLPLASSIEEALAMLTAGSDQPHLGDLPPGKRS